MFEVAEIGFPMQGLLDDAKDLQTSWLEKVTYDLADIVENNFRTAIGTSKNRNIHGKRRSAEGEIPVKETGGLADSVDAYLVDEQTGIVEVSAPYARELEKDRNRFFTKPAVRDLFDLYDTENIFN